VRELALDEDAVLPAFSEEDSLDAITMMRYHTKT
jgi:hypothetical protein